MLWLHKAEYTLVLVKRAGFGGEGQICWLILQSSVHKCTLEKTRPAIVERLLWIIRQQREGEVWTTGRNISPNDTGGDQKVDPKLTQGRG